MNRIVLDVETAGGFDCPLTYDIGFIVFDDDNIITERSWVIYDVFYGMPQKMETAYYYDKMPQYHREIANGARTVVSMQQAFQEFNEICGTYDVREVWAYNCKFDINALNNTIKILSHGWVTQFIPTTVKTRCIMGAAMSTICDTRKYAEFAPRTERGNIKMSAENVYQYLQNDKDFIESHTGLEDCKIELAILRACLKRRKKMDTEPKQIFHFPAWREIQKKYAAI